MKKTLIALLGLCLFTGSAFATEHEGSDGQMEEWFKKCDINQDGSVSKDEYTKKKLEKFTEYDKNSDGNLNRAEHDEMIKDKKKELEKDW